MNLNLRIQINLRMMRNMLSLIIVRQTLAAQMRRATIRSHLIAWERSILPPTLKIEANITPLQIVVRENTTIQTKLALNWACWRQVKIRVTQFKTTGWTFWTTKMTKRSCRSWRRMERLKRLANLILRLFSSLSCRGGEAWRKRQEQLVLYWRKRRKRSRSLR